MTCRRPPPEAVATAEDIDDVARTIAEYALAKYAVRLDPEHNLVGTLLHEPASTVAGVLSLVEDDDIQAELPRLLLGLIRTIVREGRQPDPVTVAARARRLPRDPNPYARSYDHLVIVRHIAEVYTNLGWPLYTYAYAAQVVEDAYRRDFWTGCTRLAQMAEEHTDLSELETHAAAVIDRWRAMHHRHHLLARASTTRTLPARTELTAMLSPLNAQPRLLT